MQASLGNSGIVRKTQPELRGETVIVYAFLPDGLGIWVVDDNGIDFKFADMKPTEIQRLARQFTEQCSDPRSDLDNLRSNGNELYKALIQPASTHVKPGRALVFETDGGLDGLPLTGLVAESGKYLGNICNVLSSPGFAYRRYLREPSPIRRTDRALIVGDPAINAKWKRILSPLPSAKAEAEAVSAKFDHPILLVGSQASDSNLRRDLPTAKLFQFAGHSVETNSGVALVVASPPNALSGSDLFTADEGSEAQMNLVVLSACSTGRKGDNGQGILTQSFLRARVPQVIVSRWKIDSDAALALMNILYDELLTGRSAADSLRLAENTLRHHSHTAHPYYWAPFAVIGRL